MIWLIIVGIIAGFLAGKVMNGSGYGLFMDMLLGVAGGIVGRFLLRFVGFYSTGLISSILTATFGAILLIWVVRQLRSRHDTI